MVVRSISTVACVFSALLGVPKFIRENKLISSIENIYFDSLLRTAPSNLGTCIIISGVASPTFVNANANFSVFIDRIRNQFLKK